MAKFKKIYRNKVHILSLEPNGNVWRILDVGNFVGIGTIKNKICTVYPIHGLNNPKYNKYFPVDYYLLRYARKLHIRQIRLLITKIVDSSKGALIKVKYGYIDRDSFKKLLKNRKVKNTRLHKCLLLEKDDFEIHSK